MLSSPSSRLDGKPQSVDTNGDYSEKDPLNDREEKTQRGSLKLQSVTADDGVLRFPFHKDDASPAKTDNCTYSEHNDTSDVFETAESRQCNVAKTAHNSDNEELQ